MPARELAPQERLDWLRLSRTESVGPITFYALLRRFGSARAALEALPRLGRRGEHGRPIVPPSQAEAAAEAAAIGRAGARLVCWGEPAYPAALKAVEDAPPLLLALGRPELLQRPMVAVVGARNASAGGRRFARELAAGLAEGGLVVVSGMARGIDAAAHLGALEGGTVAVVAGGVDIVYPEENRGLYEAMARQGAVVGEMPLGTEPQARHFPRRNRIISGMALGVVVVEAAARSGSLITARLALEQGREVFAVPGSPLDPRARGANDLIRNGATLTESAEDVLAQLRPALREPPPRAAAAAAPRPTAPTLPSPASGGGFKTGLPSAASGGGFETGLPSAASGEEPGGGEASAADEAMLDLVVRRLGPTPVPVDELVRQCHLSAALVATLLLELELAGTVERHPGNLVSLR